MLQPLWAITDGQESNFNDEFKLKTFNNLLPKICCKNVMDIALLLN